MTDPLDNVLLWARDMAIAQIWRPHEAGLAKTVGILIDGGCVRLSARRLRLSAFGNKFRNRNDITEEFKRSFYARTRLGFTTCS